MASSDAFHASVLDRQAGGIGDEYLSFRAGVTGSALTGLSARGVVLSVREMVVRPLRAAPRRRRGPGERSAAQRDRPAARD